jgi:hypothetical protein
VAAADGNLAAVKVLVEGGGARLDVKDRWEPGLLAPAWVVGAGLHAAAAGGLAEIAETGCSEIARWPALLVHLSDDPGK